MAQDDRQEDLEAVEAGEGEAARQEEEEEEEAKDEIVVIQRPRPNGIQLYTTLNGELFVTLPNLPAMMSIFIPVFVTGIGIDIEMIEFLIESSFPAATQLLYLAHEKGADLTFARVPELVLAETRDPQLLLLPTDISLSVKDFRLPFLGKCFSDVFAAWVGQNRAEPHRGMAPFRRAEDVPENARWWSREVFLVLDETTAATRSNPTALVAYLNENSSEEKDIQYIRCDFPTSLRLMSTLEAGKFDVNYFKERLADKDGVVRQQRFDEWINPGGAFLQEALALVYQPSLD